MQYLKRNLAVVGTSAIMAALGLGGVTSAQASSGPAPSHSQVQKTVGDETAGEGVDGSDGPDVGPDANPSEPGHQDANQDDKADTEAGSTGESESATDDGPNVGPDADPNEPGHQDADGSGDATQK